MLTRRAFLKYSAVAGAALFVPQLGEARQEIGTIRREARSPRTFSAALPIPRTIGPARSDATTDYYEMSMRAGQASILPGKQTPIWGFEGEFPGPTIRARAGRRVVVRQTNALDTHTTVHLHGGCVPPEMDGGPMSHIHPGGSYDYVYPNEQDAATLWYHDHTMDSTGRNCYMGLCGFYLLTDEIEESLPLPSGDYDVPLAIADRVFNDDGSFAYPEIAGDTLLYGALGDTILVNGAVQPRFEVANRRYRFRVLNASNARPYELALSSGAPLVQIGGDGGLLPRPVERPTARVDAAERLDLVIDFSAYPLGSRVVLMNLLGMGSTARIMCFDVTRAEADDSSVPAELRSIERLTPAAAAAERTFDVGFDEDRGLWLINGKSYDHMRVDATPRLGTTEIWTFNNGAHLAHTDHQTLAKGDGADFAHPFHLHGALFQILDRNGVGPKPWEQGWKDTVSVGLGEAVRVIVAFQHYTGVYMLHCHKLEHEDRGMMTQFEVVSG